MKSLREFAGMAIVIPRDGGLSCDHTTKTPGQYSREF